MVIRHDVFFSPRVKPFFREKKGAPLVRDQGIIDACKNSRKATRLRRKERRIMGQQQMKKVVK